MSALMIVIALSFTVTLTSGLSIPLLNQDFSVPDVDTKVWNREYAAPSSMSDWDKVEVRQEYVNIDPLTNGFFNENAFIDVDEKHFVKKRILPFSDDFPQTDFHGESGPVVNLDKRLE